MADKNSIGGSSTLENEAGETSTHNTDEINEIVHRAISKRMDAISRKFEEKLESLASKLVPPPPKEEEPEAKTLRERMAAVEEENKKLRQEREAERQASREKNLRLSLQEELTKAGVDPNLMRSLMSQLIHEDKLVSVDKAGNIVFRGEYEDETVPLADGIQAFLKTPAGKAFLPARNPQGSNDTRRYRTERQPATNQTDSDRELLEGILSQFGR